MRRPGMLRLNRLVLCAAVSAVMLMALTTSPAHALSVPPAPKDIPVVDQTATLSADQKQSLAAKIAAERTATGNQIAVLMINSLDGEVLEEYSLEVARSWGIGQEERDSGVLLLVVKNDRKLRIEVGYGLEGALPDIRASRIIQDRITPQFRQGNYYKGIDAGIEGIVAAIHGERDPALQTGQTDKGRPSVWSVIGSVWWLFLLVPVWLGSILARTKSWWAGGVVGGVAGVIVGVIAGFLFWGVASIVVLAVLGLLFDRSVSANYKKAAKGDSDRPSWWAGGPWLGGGGPMGGGGGSGGFGGFSGGSFGGGGSSGSW